MCVGSYDSDYDRPVITANLIAPDVEIGQEVSFLIDTGSDSTCLAGLDAAQAGLTPEDLGDRIEFEEEVVQGVTTAIELVVDHPFMLAFEEHDEDRDRYSLHIELLDGVCILPESPKSILGRDVLDRFDITFSPHAGRIEMARDDFSEGAYICQAFDEEMAPTLRDFGPDEEG